MTKDQSIRIFVVEDDPVYQRLVKYVVEMDSDHEVHVFDTGEACLANLGLKPDIVSLDYTLPDMTGEAVLRKIKAFNQDIGVVILSGQQDIGTAVKLLREGAFDYIIKNACITPCFTSKTKSACTARSIPSKRHWWKNTISANTSSGKVNPCRKCIG
jgi:DNA-binding NtrC family response regulator